MRRGLRQWRSDCSGVAAVEAAFVLPVLIAAALLTIETARILYAQAELGYAISGTTRYGTVFARTSAAEITHRLADELILLAPRNLEDVKVKSTTNGDGTETVTISVRYDHHFLLPSIAGSGVTLGRSLTFVRPAG